MSDHQADLTTPVRVRVRARHACESCRKRKRKCNGMEPCGECVGYGYECSFQPKPSKAAKYDGGQSTKAAGKSGHPDEPHQSPLTPLRDGDHDINGDEATAQQSARNGSISEIPVKDQSMLEPYKSRFVSAHSIIAYPRSIGIDLKMANPPRLHSYAWHTGVRPERPIPVAPYRF